MCYVLRLAWDNIYQVLTRSTYPFLTYSIFAANMICHAVTFDPLTLREICAAFFL